MIYKHYKIYFKSIIQISSTCKFQVGKSNKLEKADILEMTVDFVKRSHPVLKEGRRKLSMQAAEDHFSKNA
jgi:hypothetical protein